MGHRNYRSLVHMQRQGLLYGCCLTPADFVQAGATQCDECIKAKTHRVSNTTATEKTMVLLHGLIVDMKCPLLASTCGCKYFVTDTDEASGNCAVCPIEFKGGDAAFVIRTVILREMQVHAPCLHLVQRVRSNNGT